MPTRWYHEALLNAGVLLLVINLPKLLLLSALKKLHHKWHCSSLFWSLKGSESCTLPCLLNHEHIFFLNQAHLFWVFHTFFTRSLELEEIPHHVIDSFTLTWFSQMELTLYLTLLSVFSPWGYSFSWKPLDKEDHALTEFYKERTMEETFVPFEGIKNDLRGRLRCYKQDWTGGIRAGYR